MTQCAKRLSVCCLSYLLAVQPVLAQGIRVDSKAPAANHADLMEAPNGVPVINIARPSEAGVSHNKFTDYNVYSRGLILNNSKNLGTSQLAGVIAGNPNLESGFGASLIVNEVTSTNPSHLEGYTEVFGRKANVIVANPNGITCDGCGFINTPRITLTTGVPELVNGALSNLAVDGGSISIEGGGLNATDADKAELLARAVEINAHIHARDLSVVTGRNDYDYNGGTVTAKADDGSVKPTVAIDSAALGGMYADRITLVGTEAGVGFRLSGDMAASASDLILTADGRIEMKNASAARDVQAASISDGISLDGVVNSGGNLSISAGRDIELNGSAFSESDLILTADGRVSMKDASANNIRVTSATDSIGLSGSVNSGGELSVSAGQDIGLRDGSFTATDLTLTAVGRVAMEHSSAVHNLSVTSDSDSISINGVVNSGQTLSVMAGRDVELGSEALLETTGERISLNAADTITDAGGMVISHGDMTVDADRIMIDAPGQWLSEGVMSMTGRNIALGQDALLESGGELINLNASDTISNTGSTVVSYGDLSINADRIINDQGLLLARGAMTLEGQDAGTRASLIENDAGVMETLGGDLTLRAESLRNLGTADVQTRKTTIRHRFAQSPPPTWLPYLSDYISPDAYFQLWDEGRTQTHVFVPHPDVVERILDETGKTLDQWSDNDWKKYAPQNHSQFDPEEWVVYVPDEEQHAPPGSAIRAIEEKDVLANTPVAARIATDNGGDLYIDAGDILNNTATISAAGDLHMDGDGLTNRGIDLRHRYSLGLSYSNYTTVRALGWSRTFFYNESGPKLLINKSNGSVPATIAAGGDLKGSLSGAVINLSEPVSTADELSFGGTSSTIIRTRLGEPDPQPLFSNPALFIPASDTSNLVLETRFRYTDLGTFYGSEYFLDGLLGDSYEPDALPRRLGDAYYDTQSISRQIVDATGRRFLEPGLVADSDQVKRLLEDGIAAADDLKLSVGVALSPEQQEALTDNIVWYIEREYNGETVLVPQLYLSKATLDDLDTRAATISGQKVDIEAAAIFNVDGRVTSDESLRLAAAEDILIQGGRIDGDSIELDAGRDLSIATEVTRTGDDHNLAGSILGRRAGITADDDLTLNAGRNLTVSAADVEAGGDAELSAGNGLLVGARALQKYEDTAGIENEITVAKTINETSTLNAGGNLSLTSTGNMRIQGAELSAGEDLELLSLLADVDVEPVADSSYSHVILDKSDSRREHTRHEITQRTAKLNAGDNVSIRSGIGDISLRAAEVSAGDEINLAAGGKVALLTARDRDFEHETFQKDNGVWQKSLDRGGDIETIRHTLLTGEGDFHITTGDGVVVQYKDTGSLDDSIAQLAKAPGLVWMAELRDNPKSDWQAIQAVHEQWHHEAEGLSGPMAALITTAAAIATHGTGASVLGLSAGTGTAAAANAGFSALVSQASVSLINNKGNLTATLSELASSEVARSMAAHALTAGLLEGAGLAAETANSTSTITGNAVQIGLNVLAAENPELGQALMFLYGNLGNAADDWLQNAVGHGMQYLASHELEKFAEKNGLTLGELNLLLVLNSHLGKQLTGTTYDGEHKSVQGFFSRKEGIFAAADPFLGVIWDINDTFLNVQGLLDAVSLEAIEEDRHDHLTGHSLGAWRVNNLHRQDLIDDATTLSLPILAYPSAGADGVCGLLDFVCFGVLNGFRSGIDTVPSPGVTPWDWLIDNHTIQTMPGYDERWPGP